MSLSKTFAVNGLGILVIVQFKPNLNSTLKFFNAIYKLSIC